MPIDDFFKKNDFSSAPATGDVNSTPITRTIVKELKSEQRRTGLTGYALMKLQDDLPEGLTGNIINDWFDMHGGPVLHAPKHFLAFVFEAYKKQPDITKRWRSEKEGQGFIPVTDEFRQQLLHEEKRTGMSINKLLKKAARDGKSQIKPNTALNWLSGRTQKGDNVEMDEVLRLYAALPDKDNEHVKIEEDDLRYSTSLREIRETDRIKLQRYQDTLGILPNFIFKDADDIPKGFPLNSVKGWIDGSRKKADPQYLRWVLKRCRELVEKAVEIDKY